ncbi:unnamed protein product [Spirodela intermedia]|uniref:Translation initiation factor eIF2B subunit gamma n=1 Tax=Spirodela intermedia TaxID=51605 RepID=A0A7I8IVJ0_SPIIN|nr:unnamed protein product [Spirodela intermedia]CAA6662015.1 unnamed protein product [Spirodela intermedia]
MDFQVVVLAGGTSRDLAPLVSRELPKALLPVAERPVLSYVLDLLEDSNLKDIIVVVEEEDPEVTTRIGSWVSSAYADRLNVEVGVGTAGALRSVAPHLNANDILVVSGDLVTDVPPGAVAATHRRHDAVVTALLCAAPVSGPSETGVSSGKDKAKKPGRYNIVGLDSTRQFLLHVASGSEVEKDIRVQKGMIRAVGQMEIRVDLMDAHLYAFKRVVLQEVLEQRSAFESIQRDVLPYLVRSQLRSEVLGTGAHQEEDGWHSKTSAENILTWMSQHLSSSFSGFQEHLPGSNNPIAVPRTHKCCAYIASKSKYCVRLNSIQAFSDINRDLIGDASHISGYSFSAQNNIIHPSAKHGVKTTIGQNCMIAEGSQLGDKCNVKRSVVGRHCRIGSNVKILNSVVMNHASIEDGCTVQGSVICSNVQLQEGCVLRDCQVGAGYVVSAGSEHRGESLAKK